MNTKCVAHVESRHNTSAAVLWSSTNITVLHQQHLSYTLPVLPGLMDQIRGVALTYLGLAVVMSNGSSSQWYEFDTDSATLSSGNLRIPSRIIYIFELGSNKT